MTHRRWHRSFRLLVLVGLGALAAAGAAPVSPFRDLPVDRALALAAQQNCLVLIDFYADHCGACRKLDENTWTDPKVLALLQEKTIALKLDAGKDATLRNRFDIQAYPTVLLLKPDGTILERMLGYQPPELFLEALSSALGLKPPAVARRPRPGAAASARRAGPPKPP